MNNVVLISGVQQSDSVIHMDVYIPSQILSQWGWLENIVLSSLCYTVDPCWFSILNISSVYMFIENSLIIPSLYPYVLATTSSFSKSVGLPLFCKQVHPYHFFKIFHI